MSAVDRHDSRDSQRQDDAVDYEETGLRDTLHMSRGRPRVGRANLHSRLHPQSAGLAGDAKGYLRHAA